MLSYASTYKSRDTHAHTQHVNSKQLNKINKQTHHLHAILERLRGVFTMRCYAKRLPYLTLPYHQKVTKVTFKKLPDKNPV